jgi:endonuclease/exonuclease/phosphatase (EEP) superfamily protein YafD
MVVRGRSSAAVAVGQGFVGFGLVTVGVVGTLATILGFFGSTWWVFDFAANFRAHLAVVLLVVALAYALLFSRAIGLLFLGIAFINGLLILPLYSDSPAAPASSDTIKIVSFNVAQRSSIRDITFRWIDTVEPDIIVLVDSTDEWANAVEMAAPYTVQTELPLDRTFGITVLSAEGLDTQLLRAARIRDTVVRIEASIGSQPVVIYAVQSRKASNETDAGYRDEYLAEVGRMVKGETMPTIVVGDLEASPWSHAFRDLTAEADLKNSMSGFGLQTTWPADRWAFLRLPFDHLLHTAELTTVDRYLGPALGVDHRPIVVEVAMAAA